MLRSLFVLVVVLGALAQGPATAAPATPGPTSPGDVHPEWGSTTGHDAKLKKGCRRYAYDYVLTPPQGYWALETFLVGPNGQTYASDYLQAGGDPQAGRGEFRLCRRSTITGRYTIQALVSVEDDYGEGQSGWLPASRFRLRPKRH
jgi:hypothetical protein